MHLQNNYKNNMVQPCAILKWLKIDNTFSVIFRFSFNILQPVSIKKKIQIVSKYYIIIF